MSFTFRHSQPLGEEFSTEFTDFDSELPGYYTDRGSTATMSRDLQDPPVRGRPVRRTLPLPYPGQGIRNKYTIPVQNTAREEQVQQRINGFQEKMELLEKKSSNLTQKIALLVEISIQSLETDNSSEKQLELTRSLKQRLDQSAQVTSISSQDIDQKYKELEELDKLTQEYKSAINTKQEDIKQRISELL